MFNNNPVTTSKLAKTNQLNQLRLLSCTASDAPTNMAIDEAILEAHLQGLVPPTLRFYQFSPPAISLGYGQKLEAGVLEHILSQKFSVVRRPTGGKAVLHLNDLTYSFVGTSKCAENPIADDSTQPSLWLETNIVRAYRQICAGLIFGLAQLGVELEIGSSASERHNRHDCFEVTTAADIHYHGKKIIGSAQMRRKHAVLQHGSILLNQPQELMSQLLSLDLLYSKNAAKVERNSIRHANLFEVIGRSISLDDLQWAVKSGFEKAFGVPSIPGMLTEIETQMYLRLRPKYAGFEARAAN